jgi:hypothetical protein
MAISEKGKRRITVNERVYLWHVFDEYDQSYFDGVQVTVSTTDRELFIRYGLQQPDARRSAVISRGRAGPVRRPCPRFEGEDGVLTPQGVRALIEWSLTAGLE